MPDGNFSALQRFAQRATEPAPADEEQCNMCSEPIPHHHPHLLEIATREIMCVCRACSILFDKAAASMGAYRRIPMRYFALQDFVMSDAQWERLRIPVGMAFFFYSTPAERVVAYYPSPMGPTESLLTLDAWQELTTHNPVLEEMQPDVEALLVNRVDGAERYFLVPIDECYRLVGLLRTRWNGLSGGQEVWEEIGRFFEALLQRSKIVDSSEL